LGKALAFDLHYDQLGRRNIMAKKSKASKKLTKAQAMKQIKPLASGRFVLEIGNYNVGF
jgi:hypothetical protein